MRLTLGVGVTVALATGAVFASLHSNRTGSTGPRAASAAASAGGYAETSPPTGYTTAVRKTAAIPTNYAGRLTQSGQANALGTTWSNLDVTGPDGSSAGSIGVVEGATFDLSNVPGAIPVAVRGTKGILTHSDPGPWLLQWVENGRLLMVNVNAASDQAGALKLLLGLANGLSFQGS